MTDTTLERDPNHERLATLTIDLGDTKITHTLGYDELVALRDQADEIVTEMINE